LALHQAPEARRRVARGAAPGVGEGNAIHPHWPSPEGAKDPSPGRSPGKGAPITFPSPKGAKDSDPGRSPGNGVCP